MKLQAANRLRAAKQVEALLRMPVRNDTQRGYLVVIANMLTGDRPLGNDCRATVAQYLIKNPTCAGYINMVGFEDDSTVYHTFLTDLNFKKLADAYNGILKNKVYFHKSNQEMLANPVVATVPVKDFMRHLINGTFEPWVMQYPN